jgi:hypothetical protein
MARSRREFLAKGSLGLVGAAMAANAAGVGQTPGPQTPSTPGAPGAFGTSPSSGPEVSVETFVEAEKLVQVEMSAKDLAEAAGNWRQSMAAVYERRVGPRKLAIPEGVAPATVWNPEMPKVQGGPCEAGAVKIEENARNVEIDHVGPVPKELALPAKDVDIAYASVAQLSKWIESRQITSQRLTGIYLERLERFNKELNCVITLTRDHALEQARAADAEIAAGKYRGALHGIPWGAKDLLDTADDVGGGAFSGACAG